MARKSRSNLVKGDRVRVIRGNFRDMEGAVLSVIPAKERVVVEGVNMRKRHERPSEANPEGGIITFQVSNVMLVDTAGGQASRVRVQQEADGAKERIAVKTGNPLPKPHAGV